MHALQAWEFSDCWLLELQAWPVANDDKFSVLITYAKQLENQRSSFENRVGDKTD